MCGHGNDVVINTATTITLITIPQQINDRFDKNNKP